MLCNCLIPRSRLGSLKPSISLVPFRESYEALAGQNPQPYAGVVGSKGVENCRGRHQILKCSCACNLLLPYHVFDIGLKCLYILYNDTVISFLRTQQRLIGSP